MAVQGNSFSELATGLTSASYQATGLTTGTIYEFKVESRNVVGYSLLSDALTLTSAWIPAVPTSILT